MNPGSVAQASGSQGASEQGSGDVLAVRRAGRWAVPVVRLRPALALLGVFVAVSLAQASGVILSYRGLVPVGAVPAILSGYVTGSLGSWCALPIVLLSVVNAPTPGVGWKRFVSTHVLGYACFGVVQASVMLSLRWIVWRALSVGVLPRDLLSFFAYELQQDLLTYGAIAGLLAVLYAWQERKAAALRASQLDARWAEARLESLTARLDPHFLFNGLNTVSAMMYEDLPRTERLLAGLGQILRDTLRTSGPFWGLDREWAHTLRCLELLVARFGDRLQLEYAAPEGLERFRVPRFAVQALVENAIKHNADRVEPLRLWLSVSTAGDGVRVVVEDDGRGFGPEPAGPRAERGLARLREILRLAYGERARLEGANRSEGGARACLEIDEAGTAARGHPEANGVAGAAAALGAPTDGGTR